MLDIVENLNLRPLFFIIFFKLLDINNFIIFCYYFYCIYTSISQEISFLRGICKTLQLIQVYIYMVGNY